MGHVQLRMHAEGCSHQKGLGPWAGVSADARGPEVDERPGSVRPLWAPEPALWHALRTLGTATFAPNGTAPTVSDVPVPLPGL